MPKGAWTPVDIVAGLSEREGMVEMADRRSRWLPETLGFGFAASPRQAVNAVWPIFKAAVRSFLKNNDLLRASALTYTVALSIVPILALAFSVLKGFGASHDVASIITRLGFGSSGTGEQLMTYVNRTNAAALGSVGGALLLVTVISTMTNIERAFNTIWRAPGERSHLRKFADYLSVLFTVPLLMAAALALTAIFSARIWHVPLVGTLTPYLITWAGFFFLFVFFPYAYVQYGAALAGSFVAAVLFQLAQWAFVRFQIGAANYQAIYGALATIPLFLIWTYTAWAIVLFGAEISAAIQRGVSEGSLVSETPQFTYIAALHVLIRVADRYVHHTRPVSASSLALELGVHEAELEPIIAGLKSGGFVVEASAERAKQNRGLFLARSPATIVLEDALRSVSPEQTGTQADPRITALLGRLNHAERELLGSLTLEQFLESAPPRGSESALRP